jgi:hypothetical protein
VHLILDPSTGKMQAGIQSQISTVALEEKAEVQMAFARKSPTPARPLHCTRLVVLVKLYGGMIKGEIENISFGFNFA